MVLVLRVNKWCNKCNVKTLLENFYLRNGKPRSWCKTCEDEYNRNYAKRNPERKRQWNQTRLERHSIILKKRKHLEYIKHRPRIIERVSKYKREHRGLYNFHNAMRKHKIKQATPSWADLKAIKEFYKDCPEGYHVDHIIPIINNKVCGLHVLSNLQYLLATENLQKSNSFQGGSSGKQ